MKQKHITDYTREQIVELLKQIQNCIKINNYTLSMNEKRKENQIFIQSYFLTKNKIKDILLGIEARDFCYSVRNKKVGYEKEILHVFCPQIKVLNFENEMETVCMYVKFNIVKNGKYVIVISFHKKNKPDKYLFEQ